MSFTMHHGAGFRTPAPSKWGLYLHVPYCRMKCFYCDFNVYAVGPHGARADEVARTRLAAYLPATALEAALYGTIIEQHGSFESVYIGGGTPSLLTVGELRYLWYRLLQAIRVAPGAELTFECNPDDMQPALLKALRDLGVNRLSVGLQAIQQSLLRQLGRLHATADFVQAYQRAVDVGFENISVDVMFALPGQTLADVEETLDFLIDLAPQHVSAYGLQVEDGTAFGLWHRKGLLQLPDEDGEYEMYMATIDRLTSAGYRHYELSNFAQPGFESRHNLGYWRSMDYLGLGAGAHSFVNGTRWSNLRYPPQYEESARQGKRPLDEEHSLTRRDLQIEYMFMGLRCLDGISSADFEARFGELPGEAFAPQLDHLVDLDLVRPDDQGWRLTPRGVPLANVVFREFVEPRNE